MAKPPQAVRDKVIAALYKEFDTLQWEQLATREKSEAYERFLTSSDVGDALDPYMDRGAIRVWIKDGPAKEYGRALEGVGSYAKHTSRAYPEPQNAIKQILGNEWSVSPDSVSDKPMRCEARSKGDERRFVLWGPFAALKEVIWHALLHKVKAPTASPLIVVTRPTIAPLQTAQRKQAEAMCQLIGAEFRSIVRVAVAKSSSNE